MRRVLILMLVGMWIVSCKPEDKFVATNAMKYNLPDSVIAFDTMVNITLDIHLAEAWAQEQKGDTIPKDERLKQYYSEIFGIHQVSSQRYKNSYQYYTQQPVLMQELYAEVTEKLTIMENQQPTKQKEKKNE